jgi:NAD(P)-dependent dehydrogenase (short-subunit alcohol dehydrogenase family)
VQSIYGASREHYTILRKMPYALSFLHRQLFVKLPMPTKSFQGKTVIVTGSNVGLGLEASRWIVRLGASRLILACRNVQKGRAAAKDIQTSTGCSPETLDVWELDMASYKSVQAFASRVHTDLPRLDVFIANAGINSHQFQTFEKDEAMITVNVVSLFLLGLLLYPKLRETAAKYKLQTNLTITSSDLHEIAKFEEREAPDGQIFCALNDQSKFSGIDRYATSKLMEILLVKEIAAMAPLESRNVIINCVSPGLVPPSSR